MGGALEKVEEGGVGGALVGFTQLGGSGGGLLGLGGFIIVNVFTLYERPFMPIALPHFFPLAPKVFLFFLSQSFFHKKNREVSRFTQS